MRRGANAEHRAYSNRSEAQVLSPNSPILYACQPVSRQFVEFRKTQNVPMCRALEDIIFSEACSAGRIDRLSIEIGRAGVPPTPPLTILTGRMASLAVKFVPLRQNCRSKSPPSMTVVAATQYHGVTTVESTVELLGGIA
jgi:hypothetical protein